MPKHLPLSALILRRWLQPTTTAYHLLSVWILYAIFSKNPAIPFPSLAPFPFLHRPSTTEGPPSTSPPLHHPRLASGPLPGAFPPSIMFQPEPFPLRGSRYNEAVSKLRHITYHNQKMLEHYSEEAKPRRWRDVLGRGQDRSFSFISSPQAWITSGAEEDFRQAVGEVPVLALALVRPYPQDPARFVVVSTYNGRAAAFCLPQLEAHANWFRRCDLLPPELRRWLEDDGVFVLITDQTSPLTTDPDGFSPTRCVSTDVLFSVYQHAGVIKPHFKADKGDLAWQMVYATGYHHRPTSRPKFLQFVGEDHYRSTWPDWREPGWLPEGKDALNPQEEFFLYYEAAGLHLFVARLLQHGLVYGGMKAVDPTLALRLLYQNFLEGGEEKPWVADPLGLRSDRPEAATDPPPYVPSEFRPQTMTDEERKAPAQPLDNIPEEAEPSEVEEVPPAPTPAKRSRSEEGEENAEQENAEPEVELLLDDKALEHEFRLEENKNKTATAAADDGRLAKPPPSGTQLRLLELAQSLQPPPLTSAQAEEAVATEDAMEVDTPPRRRVPPPPKRPPVPLFSVSPPSNTHLTGANTTPVGPAAQRPPLSMRLGFPPSAAAGAASPQSQAAHQPLSARLGFVPSNATLPSDPPAVATSSPRYGPQDVRSRLFPALADTEAFKEEAPASVPHGQAPVAPCERDSNMRFTHQVQENAGVMQFRLQNRPHLRFAPLPAEVSPDAPATPPVDEGRLSNARLTHDERLRNPYVPSPIIDNRCDFCSAKHCSRFVAGTTLPNCHRYREQVLFAPTRRICDYRRCLAPHEHHTVTCPYLHKKCSKCGCRGHDTVDGCDLRNAAVMSRLRADFEEYANCGVYTRKRFDSIEWGFYPIPSFRPPDNFVSYRRLTDLPVLEAMAFLQALLLLPDNLAASRDHAPQPALTNQDGAASSGADAPAATRQG